jgi:hypothetical protein
MDNDELLELTALCMMLFLIIRRRQRPDRWRNRRWWVRPINRNRLTLGDRDNLFQELKDDATMFFRYTRMDVPTFSELLNMVQPYLIKSHPRALSPESRLAITLRYTNSNLQFVRNTYSRLNNFIVVVEVLLRNNKRYLSIFSYAGCL